MPTARRRLEDRLSSQGSSLLPSYTERKAGSNEGSADCPLDTSYHEMRMIFSETVFSLRKCELHPHFSQKLETWRGLFNRAWDWSGTLDYKRQVGWQSLEDPYAIAIEDLHGEAVELLSELQAMKGKTENPLELVSSQLDQTVSNQGSNTEVGSNQGATPKEPNCS